MDKRNALSEEHASNGAGYNHGRFLQIRTVTLADAVALTPLTWEACHSVNQEDLSTLLVPDKGITHAERRFYEWVLGGAEVRLASIGQQFAGLLVSQNVGDRIEYIRMLYTRPEFEGLGVGKGLIHSLTPRRLVFRSRRDSPPQRMLAETPSAKMVCESKEWKLWTMEWRRTNGRTAAIQ